MFTTRARCSLYRNLPALDCADSRHWVKQSNSTVELCYCLFLLLPIKNTSWHCLVLLMQGTDSCPTSLSFFFLPLCYTYHQAFWTFNKICARLCFLAWMVSFLSRIHTLLYTYFYYWHHENTSLLCLNLGVNLILFLPYTDDVKL